MQEYAEYIQEHTQKLVEDFLGYPADAYEFKVLIGASLLILFFLGGMVNSWIGASARGKIATFIGLVAPIVVALAVYSVALVNAPEYISDTSLHMSASLAVGAIAGFLFLVILSPVMLGVGPIRSVLVFGISVTLALAGIHLIKDNFFNENEKMKEVSESIRARSASSVATTSPSTPAPSNPCAYRNR